MLLAPVNLHEQKLAGNSNSNFQGFSSKPLALAAGNRSAVFLHVGDHQKECLDDIETALWFGYPEELQYKVLLTG